MKFYLVRHGQSKDNADNVHQTAASPLSHEGLRQAQFLANRFSKIHIDSIVTSPFTRARQTTDIINKNLNKPVEESELFVERKRPTVIEGLGIDDPNARTIKDHIKSNYHDPDFKHSDEETFFEIKSRAQKALAFLKSKSDQNVLVITHGDFIAFILAIMIFGDDLTPQTMLKLSDALISNNTGITMCEFTHRWIVRAWNDHAHLG